MNQVDFTKLKVGNYNRKSSESEDKQMLSIESQTNEARRIADYHRIGSFVATFQESKSAKKENNRPEFAKMMRMVAEGKIEAIVCWKPDRLARNMTEGGQIIDLLSSGALKAIITHDKVYYPWDNVIVLAVEFSQGKQFVKDLSVNVKRGQKTKAEKGTPHGAASLGFLNDKTEEKGNRSWYPDTLRLNKIKILFDMFLTGTYSAGKLHAYAVNELRLTTVQRKRTGGALITLSRIYEILKDPIYAGFFYQAGERYELDRSLPRLITEDQHKQVKIILSNKNIPKIQHHETVYAGFITSHEGDYMGQDVKYQLICDCKHKFAYRSKTHCPSCNVAISELSHPKYLSYTHYYNVRKKKSSLPYKTISEAKVNELLSQFVDEKLTFSEDLASWSKKYIHELKDKEINQNILVAQDIEMRRSKLSKEKARMREMLRNGQITQDEYKEDLEAINQANIDLHTPAEKIDWFTEMIGIVDLTQELKNILAHGSLQAKRNILGLLGSNLVWNEEKISIHNKKSINTLIEGMELIRSTFPKFEPKSYVMNKGSKEKTEPNDPVFSMMLGR